MSATNIQRASDVVERDQVLQRHRGAGRTPASRRRCLSGDAELRPAELRNGWSGIPDRALSNNPSVVSVREVAAAMGRSHSGSINNTRAIPALISHLPTREEGPTQLVFEDVPTEPASA